MRLIDVDKLMDDKVWLCGGFVGDKYAEGYMAGLDAVEETIRAMPIVDAVLVVRCKDCIYFGMNDENVPYCFNRFGLDDPEPNGYCNYGRLEDG